MGQIGKCISLHVRCVPAKNSSSYIKAAEYLFLSSSDTRRHTANLTMSSNRLTAEQSRYYPTAPEQFGVYRAHPQPAAHQPARPSRSPQPYIHSPATPQYLPNSARSNDTDYDSLSSPDGDSLEQTDPVTSDQVHDAEAFVDEVTLGWIPSEDDSVQNQQRRLEVSYPSHTNLFFF